MGQNSSGTFLMPLRSGEISMCKLTQNITVQRLSNNVVRGVNIYRFWYCVKCLN